MSGGLSLELVERVDMRCAVGDAEVLMLLEPREDALCGGVGLARRCRHKLTDTRDAVTNGRVHVANVDECAFERAGLLPPVSVESGLLGRLLWRGFELHDACGGGRGRVEVGSDLGCQVLAGELANLHCSGIRLIYQ